MAFTSQVAGTLSDSAAGATAIFTASNLPEGAKVTAVGVEDTNWLSDGQATTETGGKAVIDNVTIPVTAAFGATVSFTYEVGGTSTTVDTATMVNASNAAVAVADYEINSLKVPSGLYQSAVNNEGEVFVTRAQRTANSTLYKLNGSSLEIVAQNDKLPADGEGVFAAYGIGLDNTRGLVWVTNTRQNTVAVYKQEDLSLVAQFDTGESVHSRDVVVDEATGKAYVSAVYNNTIDVFDLSVSTTKRAAQIDVSALGSPMSLEFVADKRLDELSGGQRQRVWLALVLAQQTPIVLLDEPTSYLDITHQVEVLNLARDLQESGVTVVMVLHELTLAFRYATNLVVMRDGAVVAAGAVTDVVTESLLSDVYQLDCQLIDNPETGRPIVVPRMGVGKH